MRIGCEFRTADGKPDTKLAKAVLKYPQEHGLLLTCGPWDETIRMIPPINVSEQEVDEALSILGAALDALAR